MVEERSPADAEFQNVLAMLYLGVCAFENEQPEDAEVNDAKPRSKNMPRGFYHFFTPVQPPMSTPIFYFLQVVNVQCAHQRVCADEGDIASSPWIPYYTPKRHLDCNDECKGCKKDWGWKYSHGAEIRIHI